MIPKFRAFLKRKNKIVDVKIIYLHNSRIAYEDKSNEYFNVDMIYVAEFEDIELLQSTGLKDKNGVEIYEGYIVERSYDLWTKNGVKKIIERAVVEFYNLKFIFNGFDSDVTIRTDMLKVIGNIYKNPELLGGKDE